MSKKIILKNQKAARRAKRTRAIIRATADRPRLTVFRSDKHISAQIIDDATSRTLAAATDLEVKGKATKTEKATKVGELLAKKAIEKKVTKVVFDRGSYQYHGRVKALADAARAAGLEF